MPKFDPTSASHAVLIEVMNVLGAFREDIVLVGGWVPDLLYPNHGHMGSLDVDLAVSRKSLDANVYRTILQRMIKADYSHHTSQYAQALFEATERRSREEGPPR